MYPSDDTDTTDDTDDTDDTAGAAHRPAGEEARRLGTPGYDRGQVLLALLRAQDAVSQRITRAEPRITAQGVRDRLDGGSRRGPVQRLIARLPGSRARA